MTFYSSPQHSLESATRCWVYPWKKWGRGPGETPFILQFVLILHGLYQLYSPREREHSPKAYPISKPMGLKSVMGSLRVCQQDLISNVIISPGKFHPSRRSPYCFNPLNPHPWDYLAFLFSALTVLACCTILNMSDSHQTQKGSQAWACPPPTCISVFPSSLCVDTQLWSEGFQPRPRCAFQFHLPQMPHPICLLVVEKSLHREIIWALRTYQFSNT